MENLIKFDNVDHYNRFNSHKTLHPLVSIVDFSKAGPRQGSSMSFGLFAVMLKDIKSGDIRYGRHYYDYQDGTLIFFSPGQVVTVESDVEFYQPEGHALVFHPDLLRGTSLGRHMDEYPFFAYHAHEALHLSEWERQVVLDCLAKIQHELLQPIDKHSKKVIVTYIELLLNYCTRFYDRQFITREHVNKGIVERFEELLNAYFKSDKPQIVGLPSVSWCAVELNLSANYFGELIKKEIGKSPLEYIQNKLIDEAKERIFDPNKSISEVAYELGFKYPNHFTRLFKLKVGQSPNQYRSSLN